MLTTDILLVLMAFIDTVNDNFTFYILEKKSIGLTYIIR